MPARYVATTSVDTLSLSVLFPNRGKKQ